MVVIEREMLDVMFGIVVYAPHSRLRILLSHGGNRTWPSDLRRQARSDVGLVGSMHDRQFAPTNRFSGELALENGAQSACK
jgi:hypothetical protein